MGSSGGRWVRKLSMICLHNNAIVARGIMVTILHCGTPVPRLSVTLLLVLLEPHSKRLVPNYFCSALHIAPENKTFMINWMVVSSYLAYNAAIWLADEVWRYRDHDTKRCQDTWYAISKICNANNGLHIITRNVESTHDHMYRKQCKCHCFRRICLILQTMNYWDNEKYVLVLVVCHDGIITNPINLFAFYTRFSTVIIASWHWTLTRT